jgi:hypothetical protein
MSQGSLAKPNGRWVHDHLLSLTLLAFFVVSWIGQLYFQYQHELDEALQHGGEQFSVFSAQFTNSFWASTLENWQSEFLQLLSFVVLTTYLIHRHSHESRDSNDEMAADIRAIKNKLEE